MSISATVLPLPAADAVAERVRARLREEQVDPLRDPGRTREIAEAEVRRHNDFALARGLAYIDDEAGCVRDVLARVAGYGPLQPLLDDPEVEEIWINDPQTIFAARAGRSERVPLRLSDDAVRDIVERMLHATGRRVDLSQPFVDASLPDGSRLHVVIPDVTRAHYAVNIRKFLTARRSLDDLVAAIDPSTSYPITVYRDWMHRFETDETIPLRTRICGLLCGTLERPSSAVARLTRSDITDTGDEMTVTIGTSPLRLRDPLPALIRRHLDAPRRWDTDYDWLFPSKLRAGAHTDYSMMVKDLQILGCSVVSLRGAALLALAAVMPAGPLSDLTGISVGVANRWQTLAAAAYSSYPAIRLHERGISLDRAFIVK